MSLPHVHDLRAFEMSDDRGFLPPWDPVDQLPPWFSAWDEMGRNLPKLLVSDHVRTALETMPVLDFSQLESRPERERAMTLLSYFAHAYVWGAGGGEVVKRLPISISGPWWRASNYLGRPPVLSYASSTLYNWRRIDPAGPIALGNIALLQNFLGGLDEEWFSLVHIDMEMKAAPALAVIGAALDAVRADEAEKLTKKLAVIATSLEHMCASLDRLSERCDPYIYSRRVRPYLNGWDQPALPDGLIYDGVFEEKPRQFHGQTIAQSSIVPALIAF